MRAEKRGRPSLPAGPDDFEPTTGMRRFAQACCRREVEPTDDARCEAAKVSPVTLRRWRAREGFEERLGAEVNRLAALRSWEVLEMLRRKALADGHVQAAKIWLQHIAACAEDKDSDAPRTFVEIARMAEEEERREEEEMRRARAEQEEAEIRALASYASTRPPTSEPQGMGDIGPESATDGALCGGVEISPDAAANGETPQSGDAGPSVPCAESPSHAAVCKSAQRRAAPCSGAQPRAEAGAPQERRAAHRQRAGRGPLSSLWGRAGEDAAWYLRRDHGEPMAHAAPTEGPAVLSREERWLRRFERANGVPTPPRPLTSARRRAKEPQTTTP